MLYPQSNIYRRVYSLNGIWNFQTVAEDYIPEKPCKNGRCMPVPASMNDITTEKSLRDYIGKVVYEREFSVPLDTDCEYRLRIGATSQKCEIYLNGEKAGVGVNGYYPIDIPLKNLQAKNRLSIVIDNRLDFWTIPPGRIEDGRQTINFDFFHFTGIHRDIMLYTLPKKHIEEIVIKTVVDNDLAKMSAEILAFADGKIIPVPDAK